MNYLLDVSRFASRLGAPFDTGIDRVERAFISECIRRFSSPQFIVALGKSRRILEKEDMQTILEIERKKILPRAKGLDRFRLKLSPDARARRSLFRKNSRALELRDLAGKQYLNLGHSNISKDWFHTLKNAKAKIRVYLHDVIPLDYPQFCRADSPAKFAAKFAAVAQFADQVDCNSEATAARIRHHLKAQNSPLNPSVHYLALNADAPLPQAAPKLPNNAPIFLCLGTIEPRKNIRFLLDLWEEMALTRTSAKMPNLVLVGKRGWESDAFFNRLEKSPILGHSIFLYETLSDGEVAALMAQANALLFPSLAEGYGLPVAEALVADLPVICTDLPVLREIFGPLAQYLPANEKTAWCEKIEKNLKLATKIPKIETSWGKSKIVLDWSIFFDRYF